MLSKTPQDSYYSLISQGGSRTTFEVFNISPAAGFSSIAATPLGRSTKPGSSSEQQDFCGCLDHLVLSPIIAAASENSSEFKDSENHSKSRTSRRSRGSHPKHTPEITFLLFKCRCCLLLFGNCLLLFGNVTSMTMRTNSPSMSMLLPSTFPQTSQVLHSMVSSTAARK